MDTGSSADCIGFFFFFSFFPVYFFLPLSLTALLFLLTVRLGIVSNSWGLSESEKPKKKKKTYITSKEYDW